MKSINLTTGGGFELSQDMLNYLQTAWTETILGIAAGPGNGASAPVVISGCQYTVSNAGDLYTYSIAAGWVYYEDQLIRVTAGSVEINIAAMGAGVPALELFPTSTGREYNNGTTNNVINDIYAQIMQYTAGAIPSTYIDPTKLVYPFGSTCQVVAAVPSTINFRQNQTFINTGEFNVATGSIAIDFTNALPGAEVVIETPITGTGYLTITSTAASALIKVSSNNITGGAIMTVSLLFKGVSGGTNYYTLEVYTV